MTARQRTDPEALGRLFEDFPDVKIERLVVLVLGQLAKGFDAVQLDSREFVCGGPANGELFDAPSHTHAHTCTHKKCPPTVEAVVVFYLARCARTVKRT